MSRADFSQTVGFRTGDSHYGYCLIAPVGGLHQDGAQPQAARMQHHPFLAAVVGFALLLVPGTPCLAQVGGVTATLRGTVVDPSEAVVPDAAVTLTNIATSDVRTAVTDERGRFSFSGLFPASTDLTIELSGFKTYRQHGIALGPNDTLA